MKVRSIVFNGKYDVIEKEIIPVKHGEVLAKPYYIYLGIVEKILYKGLEPFTKPIIPGSSGVVRIIEDPSNGELSGKIAIISPIGPHGILGLDVNGILSTYTSINHKYIAGFINEPRPIHSIYPYISYGASIGKETYGSTLIIGCELDSIITAIYLKKMKEEEPHIICSKPIKHLKYLGFNIYREPGNLAKKYDTIVVGYDRVSLINNILKTITYNILVISVFSRINYIPVQIGHNIKVIYVNSFNVEPNIISEINSIIKKYIRIVRIKDYNELLGLIPPHGLGVIVGFKEIN